VLILYSWVDLEKKADGRSLFLHIVPAFVHVTIPALLDYDFAINTRDRIVHVGDYFFDWCLCACPFCSDV